MADVTVGSVFAGYRIEDVAGRGGMGVVYRARQLRPDRLVALKVIAPEFAQDPDFRTRFDHESEVAASIEHPNVIPVYEVNEEDGALFIAMRYVEATDLRTLIGGGMDPLRASNIVAQVGSALDAAHARGLVHRDIKPANVLISRPSGQDHAYLTDFGLAKKAASDAALTKTGEWVGTLDYVAPEQIQGERVDARTDVYALACVLYQAVSGKVPYPRDSEVSKIWAHINDPPPSLEESVPNAPPALNDVIHRGMAKRPDDRYPSAGDLGNAAVAASEGVTLPHGERSVARGAAAPAGVPTAVSPGETVVEEPGDVATAPDATAPGQRDTVPSGAPARHRRRLPIVAGGLAVLGAVVAALALSLGSGGGGPAKAGTVVGTPIPVGKAPTAVAVGDGSVWVANLKGDDVTRIDERTAQPVGSAIHVGSQPYGVAVGGGSVWVVLFKGNAVRRIDSHTGKVVGGPIPIGKGPADVAVGFGSVWTANYDADTVTRIDMQTGRVLATIRVGNGPIDVATGEGAVWVANVEEDTVSRINPQSNEVLGGPIPVGDSPESISVGAGLVWVGNIRADKVTRVDPKSNQVTGTPTAVGARPDDVVVGPDAVWVAQLDGDVVTRLDRKTAKVVGKPLPVGDGPGSIAIGRGVVWVTLFRAETVVRIRP